MVLALFVTAVVSFLAGGTLSNFYGRKAQGEIVAVYERVLTEANNLRSEAYAKVSRVAQEVKQLELEAVDAEKHVVARIKALL